MEEYIPQLIATGITILLFPFTKYIINKLISKYGELVHTSRPRIRQIKHIIAIVINFTFIIILMIIWGLQPQNLLFGLSSVFAVIGVAFFAQWSILSNITAGIVMFFTAPFKIGDKIHIIDKDIPIIATIENINTFYIHIRTDENELIVIPNNLFLQKTVSIFHKEEKQTTDSRD